MLQIQAVNGMQYLALKEEQRLLSGIESSMTGKSQAKYRLLVLLMLDAGCRVTEAVSIRISQLHVARKVLVIRTLKKSREHFREIPMTPRLLDALAEYWAYVKDRSPESFLFPSKSSKEGYCSRKVVWRVIKDLTGNAHPHMLRHTFCSRLAQAGTDAFTIKELAGHEKTSTTEIYIHASKDAKNQAINTLGKEPWLKKLSRKLFPRPRVDIMPVTSGPLGYTIGRKQEIARLTDLSAKKVNVLLLGDQGIGKTHLLEIFAKSGQAGKLLRIDDMTAIRKTLAGLVLTLFNGDKDKVRDLLYGPEADIDRIVTKESIKRLCELLIRTTEKHEYTIVVDDATRVTPMGITVLEQLNAHFHLIIAARQIKIQQVSFLTNFEKIQLEKLPRHEAIELIIKASTDFTSRIDDWEAFKAHIWRSTNGNPKFILEMVERFRREPFVSNELLHQVSHTTALKEIDMSLVVIISLSCLMVLRYLGGEMGSDAGAYRLIGGAFLIFALFARNLLRVGKRKFV